MPTTTLRDALGRPLREGDRVGGRTHGRYESTISGRVLRVGTARITVTVETSSRDRDHHGVNPGETVVIGSDRLFLIEETAPPADDTGAQAFRWLADEISKTMPDQNLWDGDEAEEVILAKYVRYLADTVEHVAPAPEPGSDALTDAWSNAEHVRAAVLRQTADLADPKAPEVSFFGVYGPQVAGWLRMLAGRQAA